MLSNKRGMLRSIVLLLCTLGLLFGRVVPAETPPPSGQRVFLTAHSFHNFVAPRLAPLAKAAGIEGHELAGSQMIGGSKVIQHWELPEEKNQAKRALASGRVDVLTMSPVMAYTPDDGIDRFVELGSMHNPRMRFLVQQSWPVFDGWLPGERVTRNEDRDTRSLEILRTANARFRTALEAQAGELNRKLGREAVFLVPVGDALLTLREWLAEGTVPGLAKQSELFTDPIGHGREPVLALTAYCNFACIYHRSPEDLPVKNATLDALSPELDPLLRRLAWETVKAYRFSGVKTSKAGK